MTPDPLSEKYYGLSPYAYCASNPVNAVDPDGKDWYMVESDGRKRYVYTEYTSQEEMDKAGIQGKYLGEVFIDFIGNKNEKLGTNSKIDGEGSIPATATIYGINGKDDIKSYNAMSTPYGEKGAKICNTMPALTYIIESPIGTSPEGITIRMTGVYLHRTNWDGGAQRSSTGCLIIDGRQWRSVEHQIGRSSYIYIT